MNISRSFFRLGSEVKEFGLVLRSLLAVGVTIFLLLPGSELSAQSSFPHETNGVFDRLGGADEEWSDITPAFFSETQSYLYGAQADLDPLLGSPESPMDTFMLMYDEVGRTEPLGPDEYFLTSFTTVEEEEDGEKLEHYVIHIFTDGTIIFIEDGEIETDDGGNVRSVEIEGQRGDVGFGPSPNSATPHVMAEFEIKLSAAAALVVDGAYSPDPQFWSSTLPPPTPTPVPTVTPTPTPEDDLIEDLLELKKGLGESLLSAQENIICPALDLIDAIETLEALATCLAPDPTVTKLLCLQSLLVKGIVSALKGKLVKGTSKFALQKLIDDPPDPNFTEVAVPEPVDPFEPDGESSFDVNLAEVWTNFAQQSSIAGALGISVERLLGALEAQRPKFVLLQAQAIESLLAILEENQIESTADLQALSQSALESFGPEAQQIEEQLLQVINAGFTPEDRALLEEVGFSPTDLDLFEEFAATGVLSGGAFLQVLIGVIEAWSNDIEVRILPAVAEVQEGATAVVEAFSGTGLGMVADNLTDSVTVFDPDTDTVLGTVSIGPGTGIGDVAILADGTLGFATDFNSRIWVIDLTMSPPTLAAGLNPIPISNFGEDIAITPDEKFLVITDGSAAQPVSVVDIALRAEVSTLTVGSDHNSVDVCTDGSVLVTSFFDAAVRRLTIDGDGTLSDTGEVLFTGGFGPMNVYCAPGGQSGVVVRFSPPEVRSFTIPGLITVDIRPLSGAGGGISGLINSAGDRVYVRSNGFPGAVDVFGFDGLTGALSGAPLFSIPASSTPQNFFGMDQMAISPDGIKLYLPQPGAVNVYGATTGNFLSFISDPNIVEPTGIAISAAAGPSVLSDSDDDGVPDELDNCPFTANPEQADSNFNGIGDACESPETEHDTAAFLQALSDGGTAVVPTGVTVADEPDLALQIALIVDFRLNEGLIEPGEEGELAMNLVQSQVDLGLLPPEDEFELVMDVLAQVALVVQIDIKPGSDPNSVNLGSRGSVPVAILSSVDFDALTVDPLTVSLNSAEVNLRGRGLPQAAAEDVNADGLLDLVVHVNTEALTLTESDTEAVLMGFTFGGTQIEGSDSIRVVP